jgi:RNA polymerase sigma factor for flagellar operon FliA
MCARGIDAAERERLAKKSMPLVRAAVLRQREPGCAWDDAFQDGCVGLAQALNTYDDEGGASFATFAARRISGEIIDARRRNDRRLPRHTRKLIREAEEHRYRIAIERGSIPSVAEVDEAFPGYQEAHVRDSTVGAWPFEIIDDERDLERKQGQIVHGKAVVLDSSSDPALAVDSSHPELWEALARLGERHVKAILWYYFEEVPLAELGRRLGVSQSRASQIHTQALALLRDHLKGTP